MKIELLLEDKAYDFAGFDCGDEALNTFLQEHLLRQHTGKFLRAYLLIDSQPIPRVLGYYTLSGSSFEKAALPSKTQQKRVPYRNVPAITLGRLAIDAAFQGEGWGSTLVSHAMRVVFLASQAVGIHGLFVEAMNGRAKQFYVSLGFIPLVGENERALFFPTKSIEQLFTDTPL
ncbi:GNAT family N-acetyltransferase [Kosakonia sp. H02]|nr:GNAT family N-acetyltransferase [Kosakonia sp. H02]